jgi:hypothetical protein
MEMASALERQRSPRQIFFLIASELNPPKLNLYRRGKSFCQTQESSDRVCQGLSTLYSSGSLFLVPPFRAFPLNSCPPAGASPAPSHSTHEVLGPKGGLSSLSSLSSHISAQESRRESHRWMFMPGAHPLRSLQTVDKQELVSTLVDPSLRKKREGWGTRRLVARCSGSKCVVFSP